MTHCIEKDSKDDLEFEAKFAFENSERQSSIGDCDSEDDGKDLGTLTDENTALLDQLKGQV